MDYGYVQFQYHLFEYSASSIKVSWSQRISEIKDSNVEWEEKNIGGCNWKDKELGKSIQLINSEQIKTNKWH